MARNRGNQSGKGNKKKRQSSQERNPEHEVPVKKPKESNSRPSRGSKQNDPGHEGRLSKRFTFTSFVVALVAFVAYYGYLGYQETRIYTPLPEEKVVEQTGLDVPDRFWGSYRPGVYFGMKHRSPKSLLTGLMWMLPSQMRQRNPGLRHLCQQEDNLQNYGWTEHDGTSFGVQEIYDNDIKITTSFVKRLGGKNGGDWTARISVQPLAEVEDPKDISDEIVLSYYVALEPGLLGKLDPERNGDNLAALHGNTTQLGTFIIRFLSGSGVLQSSHLVTKVRSVNDISYAALSSMGSKRVNGKWIYVLNSHNVPKEMGQPNLFIHQVHAKGPFTMEIVFESASFLNRPSMLAGEAYSESLLTYRDEFHRKFESTFHLKEKGYNTSAVHFAQAGLSNMIGGIGYFHGTSKVQSVHNSAPVPYWAANLYSTVPSRSFFPRGFLWDEGFHLLLLNKWDPEISIDIISHWLDLMNIEGWIPREQILGEEALSRVPEEFVVQKNDVANPPTLLLALHDILIRHEDWVLTNHKTTLYKMWPRLTAWYHWLNRTQIGDIPATYRWRGRNSTTKRELNPKTLASGLDDYPRASHPSDIERHLDLRCWMTVISKLMGDLAELLGFDPNKYMATLNTLLDPDLLDSLHWSKDLKAYADYGFHSSKVIIKRIARVDAEFNHNQNQVEKERVTLISPKFGFVNMFGYVSLFPMLLEILNPESEKLLQLLKQLENPNLLWTPYGLRSLATNAPLYNTRNTEHDPPYWRGPIWININFLALKSLKHYSEGEGSVATLSKGTYVKLRENLIENIMRQYYKTGYIWEQYNDANGEGKGCRPFTGWSSLVVLMMAEEY